MTSFVKTFRRAKTLFWTAFSIVIISSAVLVGLGKLLMPYSAHYQPRLESWLSKEFGRPVVVESFSGEWRAFGPQLTVRGMRLPSGDGDSGDVLIREAVIDIRPLNALLPSRALYDFRVVGAGFHLVRLADGSFELSGLGVTRKPGQKAQSGFRQIASIGKILLENSSLEFIDEGHGIHLGFRSIDAELQVHGNQVAAEVTARLADEAFSPVYGDVEATLVLQLDGAQQPRTVAWQVSGQELMLDRLRSRLPDSEYFPSEGKLTTEIWGSWESGQPHELKGVIDLRDARVANQNMDREVQHLNTRFKLSFQNLNQWRLDLADARFQDQNPALIVHSLSVGRQMSDGMGLWLTADGVPVTTPLDIAHDVFDVIGRPWPKYLPGSGIGTVKDFKLTLNENMKMRSASGHFADGQVSDWRIWPDIEGVDGEFRFGPGHGTFAVTGRDIIVTWPRMFAEPLKTNVPHCEINFAWGDGLWQVLINTCEARNEFLSAHGEMRFQDVKHSEGKPAVDINVYADRLDLSKAAPYWPRALLKERVVNWLGDGLKAGEVESARLLIRGDMDEWPFDHAQGRFEALARVTGGELFYFPGWPRAEGVEATVSFVGTGMDLDGRIGNIAGVLVDHATAHVGDFRSPLLEVSFETNTTVPRVVGFITQSPIQSAIATDLGQFGFAGNAFTRGALEIPLNQGTPGMSVKGIVTVDEGEFSADAYSFSLQAIKGDLHYDQLGLHGKELAASFRGKPAVLDLRAGNPQGGENKPVETDRLHASLTGDFAVVDLIGEPLLETWTPLRRITGTSKWQADFVVSGSPDDTARALDLVLISDLKGIAVDLPPPLSKPAEASWPLSVRIPLGQDSALATLELAGRANAAALIDAVAGKANGVAVEFGESPADEPPEGELAIAGEVENLDLDGWVRIVLGEARSGKDLAGLKLQPGTLHAGRLIFLDRAFSGVGVSFESERNSLIADFDADMLRGDVNFTLSDTGTHNLTAEFERLVLDKPLSSGMEMDIDPTTLPNLHLYAKSFRYAGIELGETRIEAYPRSEGFHFETVDAKSPNMSVRASGNWSLRDGAHRSEFDIHMASESLGDFLRQLEFASPVEGGQTLVEFGVWWDGSPGQFGLARLNGNVDFSVNSGVITDAKPGTGRLLGLLSVQSLPKRLALDFRDVFDSGFAFDEANGTFQMRNGSASTDDVVLTSSAANISLSGTTDLVARRYDQLITVRPGLGNTLPVIGAIAGGPGGAAAGLALQGLLHEQLGEASQVQYTITGAWDEPLIEPVLKTRTDGP